MRIVLGAITTVILLIWNRVWDTVIGILTPKGTPTIEVAKFIKLIIILLTAPTTVVLNEYLPNAAWVTGMFYTAVTIMIAVVSLNLVLRYKEDSDESRSDERESEPASNE